MKGYSLQTSAQNSQFLVDSAKHSDFKYTTVNPVITKPSEPLFLFRYKRSFVIAEIICISYIFHPKIEILRMFVLFHEDLFAI